MKTKPRDTNNIFPNCDLRKVFRNIILQQENCNQQVRGFKYGYISRSPPTPYLIKNKHGLNNTLPFFIDMRNRDPELGNVTNLSGIYKLFAA
jgi:hypothetical protein